VEGRNFKSFIEEGIVTKATGLVENEREEGEEGIIRKRVFKGGIVIKG
jgi:hypothetical protein